MVATAQAVSAACWPLLPSCAAKATLSSVRLCWLGREAGGPRAGLELALCPGFPPPSGSLVSSVTVTR